MAKISRRDGAARGRTDVTALRRVAPDAPGVAEVLARHVALMRAQSPAESCHVLPAEALAPPDITVFALHDADGVVAVGALRLFLPDAELKSMHTVAERRGSGFGRRLLAGLMDEARRAGVRRLYLETGAGPEHAAARALYHSAGFVTCAPYGSYKQDPLSVFMVLTL